MVLDKTLSMKEIEVFAEHQNMLHDVFAKQRTQIQILNRTVVIIKGNPKITCPDLYNKYKSTYLSKDTCKRYFTISKIIISSGIEDYIIELERSIINNKFKLSKLLNGKLSKLSSDQLKAIFSDACKDISKSK